MGLPAKSFAPVVIVATYPVDTDNSGDGTKVAVFRSSLKDTTPAVSVEEFVDFKVKVLVFMEELSIGSLNLAVIGSSTGTLVGPSQHWGIVLTTVGGEVS